MCSASGAVALDDNHFAVADDEGNQIRIYHNQREGKPVSILDLNSFLELDPRHGEADLEGAARVGQLVYWIGSHSRNPEGKLRLNRHRFFATQIEIKKRKATLTPIGRPCKDLLAQLVAEPKFKTLRFAEAASLPPKSPGALNIEGLAAAPNGSLIIGFRNPIPDGNALLVPLLNPEEVIAGKKARFGEALHVDLGGLGIRDFAYSEAGYVIVGGHADGQGHSKLFHWSGGAKPPETVEVKHFKQFNPEAVIIYPRFGLERIQILSDDGGVREDGRRCKDLPNPDDRIFRSFWVKP